MKETAFPLAAPYDSVQCKGLSVWDYFFAAAIASGRDVVKAEHVADAAIELRDKRPGIVRVQAKTMKELNEALRQYLQVSSQFMGAMEHKKLLIEISDAYNAFSLELMEELR